MLMSLCACMVGQLCSGSATLDEKVKTRYTGISFRVKKTGYFSLNDRQNMYKAAIRQTVSVL